MCSLEGDGVCESLFDFIWCKNEMSFRPAINIPDTIVYKFGQPINWYFTGLDGTVKKKFKTNIINPKIEEAFAKPSMSFDVIAYYISWNNGGYKKLQDDGQENTTIEYFNRHGLHEFLFNRRKERNGILQRFIDPKGTPMIRAIWSPKMCLMERRVNNRQLHDRRYGIYERSVTYDGHDIFSTASPLRGSVLPLQIQNFCESILKHVSEVSSKKTRICRMSINFKIDSRDRVWMLWTNSIRLASEMPPGHDLYTHVDNPVNIDDIVKISPSVSLQQNAQHNENIKTATAMKCLSCGKTSPGNNFHVVHYKTIIAHFEKVVDLVSYDPTNHVGVVEWPPPAEILKAAGGIGFGSFDLANRNSSSAISKEDITVPPVIRALHPKLAAESYMRHRRDPLFLYKTTPVCENCFLVYAELASLAFRAAGRRALTDHAISTYFSATCRSPTRSRNRYKLAEDTWRPLTKVKNAKPPGHATYCNVGSRASPALPEPIRRQADVPVQTETIGTSILEDDLSYKSPDEFIRAKEDAFFQELDLGKSDVTHPLLHMVASKKKLDSIGMAIHQWASTSKPCKLDTKKSPYEQPQVLVEHKGGVSTSERNSHNSDLPHKHAHKNVRSIKDGDVRLSQSATRYRQFLSKTLSDLYEQLESTKPAEGTASDE